MLVDADEIAAWEKDHPQPYKRDSYLGLYAEVHADPSSRTSSRSSTMRRTA